MAAGAQQLPLDGEGEPGQTRQRPHGGRDLQRGPLPLHRQAHCQAETGGGELLVGKNIYCLRSRPVDPNVMCLLVREHVEMTYRMTG